MDRRGCICSPLHEYCYLKNLVKALRVLRNKIYGININRKCYCIRTAVMNAVVIKRGMEKHMKNMVALVSELIDYGADLNEKDQDGNTVLHIIAEGIRLVKKTKYLIKVTRIILEQDVDINLKNNKGFTASDLAFKNGACKLGTLLLPHQAKPFQQNYSADIPLDKTNCNFVNQQFDEEKCGTSSNGFILEPNKENPVTCVICCQEKELHQICNCGNETCSSCRKKIVKCPFCRAPL